MSKLALALVVIVSMANHGFAADRTLILSEEGLGPISSSTKFDPEEVGRRLPGFVVKQQVSMTEGEEVPILTVSDQGSLLATINPTADHAKIFSIRITNPKVINSLGPKIGDKYSEIYGAEVHEGCEPGVEEMSGHVICFAPHRKHIFYIFTGNYRGPDGVVPPPATLKGFSVSEIIWKP